VFVQLFAYELLSHALHLLIFPLSVLSPVVINIYPGIHAVALPSEIEEQVLTELVGELVLSFEHAVHVYAVGSK
jgi:hypothetical protein